MRKMKTSVMCKGDATWTNRFSRCTPKRGTYSEGINYVFRGVAYVKKSFGNHMVEA